MGRPSVADDDRKSNAGISLSNGLLARLKAYAEANDRTVSDVVRELVEQRLERDSHG